MDKGGSQVPSRVDRGGVVIGGLEGGGGSLLIGVTPGPAGNGVAEGVHAAGDLDLGLEALDLDFDLFWDILIMNGLNSGLELKKIVSGMKRTILSLNLCDFYSFRQGFPGKNKFCNIYFLKIP